MTPDPKSGPPTLLALVSLGLAMTAEAALAGDFAGARMSLAHVRELAQQPALVNLRPSLKRLAEALRAPNPQSKEWQGALDAVSQAIDATGTKPAS